MVTGRGNMRNNYDLQYASRQLGAMRAVFLECDLAEYQFDVSQYGEALPGFLLHLAASPGVDASMRRYCDPM